MPNEVVLTTDNAKLNTGSIGTTLNGDALQTVDELAGHAAASGLGAGWYQIKAIAASGSVIASALKVGDFYYFDGDEIPASGDNIALLTLTWKSDVTGFELVISRSEHEVTPLGQGYHVYRSGKRDMSGNIEGITTIGETDADGWVLNNFIRKIAQATDGSVTVTEVDDSPILVQGVMQKDTSSGETEVFVLVQIILLNTQAGAKGDGRQEWQSDFRIAAATDAIVPTLYERAIA